jgi:uncharacterized protein YggU (UPF0235/DUF167 family)
MGRAVFKKDVLMQPKRVKVRVTPGARVARIDVHPDSSVSGQEMLCVYVKALAKEDRANQAVIKALADHWSIPPSYIRIKHGLKSRDKIILVHQV